MIRDWVAALGAYELAALERGVLATKSLCVASRLLVEWSASASASANPSENANQSEETGAEGYTGREGRRKRFGVEEAAEACSAEVRWQTGMWGEVEDTHDVEREDLRRQLGSVVLMVCDQVQGQD